MKDIRRWRSSLNGVAVSPFAFESGWMGEVDEQREWLTTWTSCCQQASQQWFRFRCFSGNVSRCQNELEKKSRKEIWQHLWKLNSELQVLRFGAIYFTCQVLSLHGCSDTKWQLGGATQVQNRNTSCALEHISEPDYKLCRDLQTTSLVVQKTKAGREATTWAYMSITTTFFLSVSQSHGTCYDIWHFKFLSCKAFVLPEPWHPDSYKFQIFSFGMICSRRSRTTREQNLCHVTFVIHIEYRQTLCF